MSKRYKTTKRISFAMILISTVLISYFQIQPIKSDDELKSIITDTTIANMYFSKAKEFSKDSKYDSSNFYYDKALIIYKSINKHDKYIYAMSAKAGNLIMKSNFDSALTILEPLLQYGLQNLGKKQYAIGKIYAALGRAYYFKARFKESLDILQKAEDIFLSMPEEKARKMLITCSNDLGNLYFYNGDYDQSLNYYYKSLNMAQKLYGEQSASVAKKHTNIAMIYAQKGSFNHALNIYKKALNIAKEVDIDGRNLAHIYSGMGAISYNNGDYLNALSYAKKVLSIEQKIFGENHVHLAASYYNVSIIYGEMNNFEAALEYQKKALDIRRTGFGEKHHQVARDYCHLGEIYNGLGKYKQSLKMLNYGLKILTQVFDDVHPLIGYTYSEIGDTYKNMKNILEAKRNYSKSLDIYHQLYGKKHHDIASIYYNLSTLCVEENDYSKALNNIQQALISSIPDFNDLGIYSNPKHSQVPLNSDLLDILSYKAGLLSDYSNTSSSQIIDLKNSLATYELAALTLDSIMFNYTLDTERLEKSESIYNLYSHAIEVALSLFNYSGDISFKQKAFLFAEKGKSTILLRSIFESKALKFGGIPDSLIEKERQLKTDLLFYKNKISEEQNKNTNMDSSKIKIWQDKEFVLHREYEKLTNEFEKNYKQYYNLKYSLITKSPQDLQEKVINDSTVLVEYFMGDSTIFIFRLTKNDFDIISVKKDRIFDDQINLMRSGIIERDYNLYTKNAYRLYQILIEPIIKKIKVKNLIIIPDGILSHIPFETLLSKKADHKTQDYRKLAYLIKDYQITYDYSATILYENMNRQTPTITGDILGFAPTLYE